MRSQCLTFLIGQSRSTSLRVNVGQQMVSWPSCKSSIIRKFINTRMLKISLKVFSGNLWSCIGHGQSFLKQHILLKIWEQFS